MSESMSTYLDRGWKEKRVDHTNRPNHLGHFASNDRGILNKMYETGLYVYFFLYTNLCMCISQKL